jgi:hypothetical protein
MKNRFKSVPSNVSDFLKVVEAIYKDATAKCTADVSDFRDLKTIRSRVMNQGLSFLTITLPQFSKDFERSLAIGYIDSTFFRTFRKNGSIPAFLQGMTSLIFDRETGRIINEQNTKYSPSDRSTLVESVRQICLAFKKVEIACTPEREQAALGSFIEVEHAFNTFSLSDEEYDEFCRVSRVLWDNPMANISLNDCNPKHGPGATADRRVGNHKYVWLNWHDRLESYFPIVGNGYPLGTLPEDVELENVTIVSQDQEQPVKVTPVPKTLKGPRIIAIEPCCMQFVQQGIRDVLYNVLESYPLTKSHVNFRDQKRNQRLAIRASRSGRLATIDLSDASDRVPRSLALYMFRANPDLMDSIDACRSTRAEMPDGSIVEPLQKFASMGSALCFPVEAMYFYTLCVMALLKRHNLPVSYRNSFKVSRAIYVYGDDIIVPSADAVFVLDYLQRYNCKVNAAKSFWTGKFRESCGVDAYDGRVVSPTYIGTLPPENKRQAERLISWTATGNLFYKRGYWRTAQLLFNYVEAVIGPLPYLSETSPGLGRYSFLGYRTVERWQGDRGRIRPLSLEELQKGSPRLVQKASYQRFEVKAWVPSPVYRKDRLEGNAALSASLSRLAAKPSSDVGPKGLPSDTDSLHLERFALHGAVTLKRRWVSA